MILSNEYTPDKTYEAKVNFASDISDMRAPNEPSGKTRLVPSVNAHFGNRDKFRY